MTRRSSQPHAHPGLSAALAVVRLVMQLVEAIFADMGDLPENHPDRRCHDRLCRELRRAEARILAEMAAVEAREAADGHAEARAVSVWRGRCGRTVDRRRQAVGRLRRPSMGRPRAGRGPPVTLGISGPLSTRGTCVARRMRAPMALRAAGDVL